MSHTEQRPPTDSLTFFDLYRADREQLERRLAQIETIREIREERRRIAAVRREALAPARTSALRRRVRALLGRDRGGDIRTAPERC
jgi:hypothetical protein